MRVASQTRQKERDDDVEHQPSQPELKKPKLDSTAGDREREQATQRMMRSVCKTTDEQKSATAAVACDVTNGA
jgi:hypothetical protein